MSRRAGIADRPLHLITGGAGFIGTNLADRLLSQGARVLVLDDLSHPGAQRNLAWLRGRHCGRVQVQIADVRDLAAVRHAVDGADRIFHLAAQAAMASSLSDPLRDFEINLRGTLNVLEAARARQRPPPILVTSTNRVYGALADRELELIGRRYVPADPELAAAGIDERRTLDFHSPYACSKGAADLYALDYARSFGVPAVVLRMSSVYGPHQCGTEDQWAACFLMRARERKPLTIHGDGCQVRDLLFVEDLVDALLLAMRSIDRLAGQAFNIGGGPGNMVSMLELLDIVTECLGLPVSVEHAHWRSGEQRYYVANIGRFAAATGWSPAVTVPEGVRRLHDWLDAAVAVAPADPGPVAEPALP